jgi:hypothetical protein
LEEAAEPHASVPGWSSPFAFACCGGLREVTKGVCQPSRHRSVRVCTIEAAGERKAPTVRIRGSCTTVTQVGSPNAKQTAANKSPEPRLRHATTRYVHAIK